MDIEKIYNDYFKIVYRYILSLSRDPELSEDITHDTFLKALKRIEELGDDDNVQAWLCRIARNDFYKRYNRKQRHVEIINSQYEEPTYDSGPEAELVSRDERVKLHQLLHSLEDPYKEVFSLRTFGDLTFKEIGQVFGKTENWARVTYHRARRKLMEAMDYENKL